jgi:hypothetical protein
MRVPAKVTSRGRAVGLFTRTVSSAPLWGQAGKRVAAGLGVAVGEGVGEGELVAVLVGSTVGVVVGLLVRVTVDEEVQAAVAVRVGEGIVRVGLIVGVTVLVALFIIRVGVRVGVDLSVGVRVGVAIRATAAEACRWASGIATIIIPRPIHRLHRGRVHVTVAANCAAFRQVAKTPNMNRDLACSFQVTSHSAPEGGNRRADLLGHT